MSSSLTSQLDFDLEFCTETVECRVFDLHTKVSEDDHRVGLIVVGCLLSILVGGLIAFVVCRTCLRKRLLTKAKAVSDQKNADKYEERLNMIERKKQARLVQLHQDSSEVSSTSCSDNEPSSEDEEKIDTDYLEKLSQPLPDETASKEELEMRAAEVRCEQEVQKEVEEEVREWEVAEISTDLKAFHPRAVEQTKSKCLAHILVLHQREQVERELLSLEVSSLVDQLCEWRSIKFKCAVHLVKILLNPLVKKQQKVDADMAELLIRQLEKSLEDEWSAGARDLFLRLKRIEKEDEGRDRLHKVSNKINGSKSEKEIEEELLLLRRRKESAIRTAQSEFLGETSRVLETLVDLLQSKLRQETDLSLEEVSNLIRELKSSIGLMERMSSEQLFDQHMISRKLFEKRRKLALPLALRRTLRDQLIHNSLDSMTLILKGKGGEISEKQLNEAVAQYESMFKESANQKLAGEKASLQSLSSRLADERDKRVGEVKGKLEADEKEEFFGRVAKTIKKPDQFVQEFLQFLSKQREDIWTLIGQLDEEEAKTVEKESINPKTISCEAGDSEKTFTDWLVRQNMVANSEVNYVLKSFENQQKKFLERKSGQLKEKVDEISKQYTASKDIILREVSSVKSDIKQVSTKLENSLNKLLDRQIGMEERAKEVIQAEFDYEVSKISFILTSQKLMNLKIYEFERGDRLCKMQVYKDRQRDDLLMIAFNQRESAQKDQAIKLSFEKKRVEFENSRAELSMRNQISSDTNSAVKKLEVKLSELMGKVNCQLARRTLLTRRQNNALESIDAKLREILLEKAENDPSFSTTLTKLIQEFEMDDKQHAKMTSDSKKEEQRVKFKNKTAARLEVAEEKVGKESLSETKKQVKEHEIKDEDMRKLLLSENKERKLNEVKRDLKEEEALDLKLLERKLKKDYDQNIEESRKELIGKLAAFGEVTESEVKELLLNAIIENGVEGEKAKQLGKDIRKRFKATKDEIAENKKKMSRKNKRRLKNESSPAASVHNESSANNSEEERSSNTHTE
ncbi:myosin-9-like [Symsagittifera roscoffensis]|uniref:myosin-9-like n=1 Tax=Symsagittifera roscoffensis TaxID=84072 RepID=UPI00307CA55C